MISKRSLRLGSIVLAGAAIIASCRLYNIGKGRCAEYKAIVTDLLKESLVQEMDARPVERLQYISHIGEIRPWESLSDTVLVKRGSAAGLLRFNVPTSDLRNNIAGTEKGIDGAICSIHSAKLFENPMDADTLYQRWRRLLPFGQHPELGMRMSYTDFYGKQTVVYVPDINRLVPLDSLCTWNVGTQCELKATAYCALPKWWQLLTWWERMLPVCLLVCFGLLYVFRKPLCRVWERLFVREKVVEKVVTQVREVEKVKEVEKTVYVKCVEPNEKVKTYRIEGIVYFNSQSGELWDDRKKVTLGPQPKKLLKIFLEAEDYRVEKQYLIEKFWPKQVDPAHTMHNAISRLRKEVAGFLVITSDEVAYQIRVASQQN